MEFQNDSTVDISRGVNNLVFFGISSRKSSGTYTIDRQYLHLKYTDETGITTLITLSAD
jgi:hypothetical protein